MDTKLLIEAFEKLAPDEKLIIQLSVRPDAEQIKQLGAVLEDAAPGRWLVLSPDAQLVKVKASEVADVIDVVAGHCRSATAREELREKATAIREHGWSGA